MVPLNKLFAELSGHEVVHLLSLLFIFDVRLLEQKLWFSCEKRQKVTGAAMLTRDGVFTNVVRAFRPGTMRALYRDTMGFV